MPRIAELVQAYVVDRRLLAKDLVTLYEDVQEFVVAEQRVPPAPGAAEGDPGTVEVVGCGALHVMWSDLAEVRTVAVSERARGAGVGRALVSDLIRRARGLGVARVFCLTFEREFFASFGFAEIEAAPVAPEVYAEMLRSHDEGVAEFLDLARVKANTLGNSRMLLRLDGADEGRTVTAVEAVEAVEAAEAVEVADAVEAADAVVPVDAVAAGAAEVQSGSR